MMILETSIQNGTSRVARVIALTPEALRACADTLESLSISGCDHGDSVLYQLTPAITVLYKPEPYRKRAHQAEEATT